jgi:hypothetical protein
MAPASKLKNISKLLTISGLPSIAGGDQKSQIETEVLFRPFAAIDKFDAAGHALIRHLEVP